MSYSVEDLLESAKHMADQGADDRTITLAMAEQGIPDYHIDETVAKLKKYRKSLARARGMKELLYGGSIVAIGIVVVLLINTEATDFGFAFYLIPFAGLSVTARGLVRILIP